jgi:hypothetical protein
MSAVYSAVYTGSPDALADCHNDAALVNVNSPDARAPERSEGKVGAPRSGVPTMSCFNYSSLKIRKIKNKVEIAGRAGYRRFYGFPIRQQNS